MALPALASPLPASDEEALIARLLAKFESPRYKPPTLPTVALELLELSQKSNTQVPQLVALLERDPMLAAQVLKLVNSAAYAGRMPIQSLKDAVVRLGMGRLRDVVMEASMSVLVFRGDGYSESMERLRQHATITGHLTRLVCRATPIAPEFAFLCGLLHDIGVTGALIALADESPRPDLALAWPAVERVHERASQIIARLWRLPREIELVLGVHHAWNAEGTTNPMGAVVCVAHVLAEELGYAFTPAEADDAEPGAQAAAERMSPEAFAAALEALELGPATLTALRAEARQLTESLGTGRAPA